MKYNLEDFDTKTNKHHTTRTEKDIKHNTKNKGFSMLYVIAGVFAVAVIAFVLFLLFSTSDKQAIENTWLHKSTDGNDYYYTFSQNSQVGEVEISIGTDHFMCTFELDENTVIINYGNGQLYTDNLLGEYTYTISEKNGADVLILESIDGTTTQLVQTDKPSDSDYLKPYDDFVVNDDIIGKWKLDYSIGSLKLEIKEDGTLVLNLFDIEYQHYVYTTTKDTIRMAFYKEEKSELQESYELVQEKLKFLGVEWERDN